MLTFNMIIIQGGGTFGVEKMVYRVLVVVNQYFATIFGAGPMLESQKMVGPGPMQPVRWLRLCHHIAVFIRQWRQTVCMSSARFVRGTPSGASQPPSLYCPPKKIVKISQKYIADPLWFSIQLEYCAWGKLQPSSLPTIFLDFDWEFFTYIGIAWSDVNHILKLA